MQQGDIVITDYPFTSFTDSKIRPAMVISNETFNKGSNIILLAISTKKGIYFHELNELDLEKGKLLKKSYIRFSNILSIEKHLILKTVAQLKPKITKNIINQMVSYLK